MFYTTVVSFESPVLRCVQ